MKPKLTKKERKENQVPKSIPILNVPNIPESATEQYLIAWKEKDLGRFLMSMQRSFLPKYPALKVYNQFFIRPLLNFEILETVNREGVNPAVSKLVKVRLDFGLGWENKTYTIPVQCEKVETKDNDQPIVYPSPVGIWGVYPSDSYIFD